MQKDKLDKNIEANLFSADTGTVVSTLNTLKEHGNVEYLPLLFDLLKSNPEKEVEQEITTILGGLKMSDAVPVLTDALRNPAYLPIRKKLTTACWQNGLDYKDYLPLFVELVINEDWETGFEAFTVIENMKSYPDEKIKKESANKIHEALKDADEQKKYFLHEILTFIVS